MGRRGTEISSYTPEAVAAAALHADKLARETAREEKRTGDIFGARFRENHQRALEEGREIAERITRSSGTIYSFMSDIAAPPDWHVRIFGKKPQT